MTERELNFWVMPNAEFATRSVLAPFIAEYETRHPGVRIKLSVHPWSLGWSRLMDSIKGRFWGAAPDVIQVGTTWTATLAYLGALEAVPKSGVLPGEEALSAYIWDPGAQGDSSELFCVPWFIDVRVLFYRKDLLEKLKLGVDSLRDWKGFYRTCEEIQKYLKRPGPMPSIVAPLALPGQKLGVLMHDLAPWVWEAGGHFCSEDLTSSKLSDPATKKGIETYFNLIERGFMPIPNVALPRGNFFTGHYAMQLTGSWPVDAYLNTKSPLCNFDVAENFGVTMFPSGPAGRYTFLGGSNLGVTSTSPHKELAWDFIRFLTEPERQLAHARAIGALPPRVASMEQLFDAHPGVKKVYWDSLAHARRLPRIIPLGSIEQIVSKMGGRLLSFIQTGKYNGRIFNDQIEWARRDMDIVLSLHRYSELAARNAA